MNYVLTLLLINFISFNSYAQQKCSEVVKSKVTVNIKGVEFKFSNTDKNTEQLEASLNSLLSLVSGEPSQINRLIQNQKIAELKRHFSGPHEVFYENLRVLNSIHKEGKVKPPPKNKKQSLKRKKISLKSSGVIRTPKLNVKQVVELSDGRLATVHDSKLVQIWQPKGQSYKKVATLEGHTKDVTSLIELSNGNLLTWSEDATVRIWEGSGDSYKQRDIIKGELGVAEVDMVVELSDGQLAMGATGRQMIFLEKQGGSYQPTSSVHTLDNGTFFIVEVAGGRLITANRGGGMQVFESKYRKDFFWLRQNIAGHEDWVLSVIELSDGRLVSTSGDNTARLWVLNGENYEEESVLRGHQRWVKAALELDEGRLVTASADGTVRVWEEKGGAYEEVGVFEEHTAPISSMIKLKDGRIVTGGLDNTFRLWEVEYGEEEL